MKKTIYLSIYEKVKQKIINGTYVYGTYIASKRTMAEDYHVSLVSVEHAYDLLSEEGYIDPVERKGYMVIYREKDFFAGPEKKMTAKKSTLLENHEYIAYSTLAKTMRKVMNDHGEEIMLHKDRQGLPEFRRAIAAYLARSRNIYVSADQILITAGAEAAYSLIVEMLGRYRIYGIEKPSYEKIEQMYLSEGVHLDHLKMGAAGILTSELERTPASVLHATPFSSYPTGVTADAGKRQEYITWARKQKAFIVEDDYASEYSPSTKTEETLFAMEPEQTVFYMNSFTKTIAPAVRISYIVLPGKLKEKLLKEVSFRDCGVSAFDQLVAAELMNNGSFEKHLNKVKREMRKKK
ncbi:MAG: PLP-dependent aminotransferase family protein [Solobacterium sp.]|jgi:GntR family transcriptional regulator/MocR family aminotransferase|nr:PLP-dependent aminotransferase family protein [Solobacterium sp.]